ncbi:hypothetical protein [Microbispora sp. CA-102843]|uniref:hypothetical protein n=1 Tax=Microbispora sp. CA-102843 TaxID=3239952 RepID=UPI003D8E5AA8
MMPAQPPPDALPFPEDPWEQLDLARGLGLPRAAGPWSYGSAGRTAAAVPPAVWRLLLNDTRTRRRYAENVHQRRPADCWFWLGAISSTGHGKMRASNRACGVSRVVTAHVYGYQLAHGAIEALPGDDPVIAHRCDEASCQNPAHWRRGTRAENNTEYAERRRRLSGPLADVRGAAGRAVAVRDAILRARSSGADVEAAIAAALAEGLGDAPTLF